MCFGKKRKGKKKEDLSKPAAQIVQATANSQTVSRKVFQIKNVDSAQYLKIGL